MSTDGDADRASQTGASRARADEEHTGVVESPSPGAGAPPGGGETPARTPADAPGSDSGHTGMPAGPPVWHDVYEVSSYWADMTGHAYPHGILEMLQDSAWRHAEALGLGYSHLDRESLLWVLSRLDVHITRMPQWGETVRLETWPTGTHRLFALREFCLYDDDERELLRANSAWLVIDGENRKPRKPGPVVERRRIPTNPGNYDAAPPKVEPPTAANAAGYELTARYSDLDAQRHVNNARYVEWMLNGLPDDWMDTHTPRELSVNFLRECGLADAVRIVCDHHADAGRERTLHSVLLDDSPVCVMTAVWASR